MWKNNKSNNKTNGNNYKVLCHFNNNNRLFKIWRLREAM